MAKTSKTAKKPAARPKAKRGKPAAGAKSARVTAAPSRKRRISAPPARAAKPKPVAKPKPRVAPSAKKAPVKPRVAPPKPKPPRPKRPTAPPKLDLAEFRERLLIEQERLQDQLTEIEQRTARSVESETPSELSGYEDHPADLASETFEREKDLALEENLQDMLNKVRTALEKIEAGTYGICDVCGQGISKYRMEALPFATLCVDCQSRLETR